MIDKLKLLGIYRSSEENVRNDIDLKGRYYLETAVFNFSYFLKKKNLFFFS